MSGSDDEGVPAEGTRMTLGEHLGELRRRLFYSVIAVSICFGVAWWFKEHLADTIMWPWHHAAERMNADLVAEAQKQLAEHPELPRTKFFVTADPADLELRDKIDKRLVATAVGESFFFALNVSIYCSLIVSAPFVLFQIWAFVAAGLYRHEKRAILKYFPFSAVLFLAGVYFCYRWVVPIGMYYLSVTLPTDQVRAIYKLDEYFSFLSTMCIAMGCVFQLPLVMLFLSKLGIVDPKTYGQYRGHFLVGALFVAAVVTPGPDWYSQVLMTIPMVLLYEVGILLAKFSGGKRSEART